MIRAAGVVLAAVACLAWHLGWSPVALAFGVMAATSLIGPLGRPPKLPAGGESPRGEWPPSNRRPGDNTSRKEPR